MKNDLQKIKEIMGTNKPTRNICLSHYTPEQKINAIYMWREASSVSFNTSFLDSVSAHLHNREFITTAQDDAIDNIIRKFNICMDTWG
jgi:hypothetical protein